jgi:hypothetical protein
MPCYRTDPETGRLVAYSDELVGCHTLMDQHAEKVDFEKMMIRRAAELPHRRVTARSRDLAEFMLGQRSINGIVLCAQCQAKNREDSNYCQHCSAVMTPITGYAGINPGEDLKCHLCNRVQLADNLYCTSCGRSLAGAKTLVESKSRPRSRAATTTTTATPRRFQNSTPRKQPSLRALPFGTQLVAKESFVFKMQSGHMSKVTAGITYCARDSEAYKAKPSAFVYA